MTNSIVQNQPPIHRKGQCQWCDLYRSTSTPFRGHCPEQDIKAEDVVLLDPLKDFGANNSDPPQRRTDAEVEALKRQWRKDPCWDLDATVGFEAHRDELAAYEDAYWTEAQQAMEHKEQTDREVLPAVNMLPCVQVYGDLSDKRRVVWINPTAISYFTEFVGWRPEDQQRPSWTLLSMTNGQNIKIDTPAEQFAGWLRGDRPPADVDEPPVEDVKAREP